VSPALDEAYASCERIARSHYENFTVGSFLLPRELRRPIAAIYAFSRIADDIADEGDRPAEERLAELDAWEAELDRCFAGRPAHPVFVALADTVQRFAIPDAPFRALLDAFRRDVRFTPFADYAALEDYCRRSANPVGHLILYLFGHRDAERQALSDRICTGLQLANFWQDVSLDAAKGRVYVPREDLLRFGCSEADLARSGASDAVRVLLRFEVERSRRLLHEGLRLTALVAPRLQREVWLFARGGLAILDRIAAQGFDVLRARPSVPARAKLGLVLRAAFLPRPYRGARAAISSPATNGAIACQTPAARLQARDPEIESAYAFCRDVAKRSSSNFYPAFRLLTAPRRDALCAVYAFCRFVDDLADESEGQAGAAQGKASLLERWREEVHVAFDGRPTRPVSRALADAARRYPLDRAHFLELIRGVEMDLTQKRYQSFDELRGYCYRVASAVGLLCIEIFGYSNPSARQYAVDLGIAFQLTNILRDVLEDGARGRLYLPLDDLRQFDCSEDEVLAGRYTPQLAALLAFECGRARAYYLRAAGALAAEDRSSLATAEAMRRIYERLLDRIEARRFDVFGPRVALKSYEKVALAASGFWRSQLRGMHLRPASA
jgi:phytoene synthase